MFDEATVSLLRCPITGQALRFERAENCLYTLDHSRRYPIVDGIALLLPEHSEAIALLTAEKNDA